MITWIEYKRKYMMQAAYKYILDKLQEENQITQEEREGLEKILNIKK